MIYTVYARNLITNEEYWLGDFYTREEAQYAIDTDLIYDEDDNPADWVVEIREDEDIFYEEPDDIECGFDPYGGCYTYDC